MSNGEITASANKPYRLRPTIFFNASSMARITVQIVVVKGVYSILSLLALVPVTGHGVVLVARRKNSVKITFYMATLLRRSLLL